MKVAPQYNEINKTKVYLIALVLYIILNFIFEALITLLENATKQWLYPIFPYTRIGLLLIVILATNYYIRRRTGKPKPRLWWRVIKPIIITLVFYGLTMGAWLSVSQADADRAREEYESSRIEYENRINNLPSVQEPTLIITDTPTESEGTE